MIELSLADRKTDQSRADGYSEVIHWVSHAPSPHTPREMRILSIIIVGAFACSTTSLPERLRPIQHHCKCGPAGCGRLCDQEALSVQRGLICPEEVASVDWK